MSNFICFRCGYVAKKRCHLVDHLNRIRICPPVYAEIDRTKILEMLSNGAEFTTYLELVYPLIKKNNDLKIKTPVSTNSRNLVNFYDKNVAKSQNVGKLFGSSTSPNDKPIEKIDILVCSSCNRSFNNRQTRWKHEKHCSGRETVINTINSNNSSINSHNTTNNTFNNNLTVNQHALVQKPLCIFGEEDLSYIVKVDMINDYERIARRDPSKVIPTVVKDIYFNSDHPENHTVRIENIHGNLAMIRVGLPDKWEYVDRRETIHNMIRTGINAMETGNIDIDNLPRYDILVNNYYSETNPQYNNTIKAVDTTLVIDLHKQKLLK